MQIVLKIFFSVLLILVFTSEAHSECLSQEESYTKYVLNAVLSKSVAENDKSINLLKKHLLCYPEKEVYYKLAVIYEYSGKYYLAGIAYKKSGKVDELKRLEQLSAQYGKDGENMFKSLSAQKAADYSKSFKAKKAWATAFNIIGPVAFATGLSLFIHDKAGGENSLSAQYVLMLGGLTMVGGGTILNAHAEKNRLLSKAYNSLGDQYPGFYGTDPDKYFVHSGISGRLHKNYSDKYFVKGLALIFVALPIIGFGIYSYFDTIKYIDGKDDYQDSTDSSSIVRYYELLATHLVQTSVFVPAISFIVIGSKMMADSSKWKKMNTEPSLFTLNSITPIINPISKTYGLALGFSF